MRLLAFSDNPLGHVVDKAIIGGKNPVFVDTASAMPYLTVHMVSLIFAGLISIVIMLYAAGRINTGSESEGHDRYLTKGRFSQMIEVIILYMQEKAIHPVLGDANTKKYLPFLLTLFFFILVCNIVGLFPMLDVQYLGSGLLGSEFEWAFFGGTATSNLAVTAALAVVCFVVIQVHAFKELGLKGWLGHLTGGAPIYLLPIMLPVEFMGMLIKPSALAIRLFANMVAGHTLMSILALFGKMAYGGLGLGGLIGISAISIIAGVAIGFLELFVAFLQAFIFMFLTAVFISQMSHHHEDHHEEYEEGLTEYSEIPAT